MFKEGMNWVKNDEMRAREDLTAMVIGQAFLAYMRETGGLKDILAAVDGRAMQILEEIRRTLDDETLNDPECFFRIEKILTVLESHYIGTSRHDW